VTCFGPDTEADDQAAVAGLFDVLDEFLAEFPVSRSRSRLYHEYFLWKQQLSFSDLDLERFRSSPPPDTLTLDEAGRILNLGRGNLFDLVAGGKLEPIERGRAGGLPGLSGSFAAGDGQVKVPAPAS
jgi:hypothetical protein